MTTLVLLASIIAVTMLLTQDAAGELSPRGIIDIHGDGGFTVDNGVSYGDGSSSSPYIIEGWYIAVQSPNPVRIRSTTKHFILRDIVIEGPVSGNYGIWMEDITAGTVRNVTIKDMNWDVYLLRTKNLTIGEVTMDPSGKVTVYECASTVLFDMGPTTSGCTYLVQDSNAISLMECQATMGDRGISLSNSRRCRVSDCVSKRNAYGLFVQGGGTHTISGSTITNNTQVDLYLGGLASGLSGNSFGPKGVHLVDTLYHDIDGTNTVNGHRLHHHCNETGGRVTERAGQVFLVNCTDFIVADQVFIGPLFPMVLRSGRDCIITNVTVNGARYSVHAISYINLTIDGLRTVPAPLDHEPTTGLFLRRASNLTIANSSMDSTFKQYAIMVDDPGAGGGFTTLRNVTVRGAAIDGVWIARGGLVTIEGCQVHGSGRHGMYIHSGDSVTVANTTITTSDDRSLLVRSSDRVSIARNVITGGYYGVEVLESTNVTISNNSLRSNRLEGITLSNADGTVMVGNTIHTTGVGIDGESEGLFISMNTIVDCGIGIDLGSYSVVTDCSVDHARKCAVETWQKTNVTVTRCRFNNTEWALWIRYTTFSEFSRNVITNGTHGVYDERSSNCTYRHNTFEGNDNGIMFWYSQDNRVFLNNFVSNNYDGSQGTYKGRQVEAYGESQFDNGVDGNYWDDYTQWYPAAKVVGRHWDTPYEVEKGPSEDRFPMVSEMDLVCPVAIAGPDVTVPQNTTVQFDGSRSWDDVGVADLHWTFRYGGDDINLTGVRVSFTFDLPGVYVVLLTVEDAFGNPGFDDIVVTVIDTQDPVADAGGDLTVGLGRTFQLDGTGSRDNGRMVDFVWTVDPGGLDLVLEGAVVDLTLEVLGRFTVTLWVFDTAGNQDFDTLIVTVVDLDPPVANAGGDLRVDQGETVHLSGHRSTDNVGISHWNWSFEYGGETVVLHGEKVSHTFDVPGTYVVVLRVTDDAGWWSEDPVTVVVRDTEPPTYTKPGDMLVELGDVADFQVDDVSDNVAIRSVTWSFREGHRDIELEGQRANHTFEDLGHHEVTLTVWDTAGNVVWSKFTVSVVDTTPPTVVLEVDGAVDQFETVVLDGGGSRDLSGLAEVVWTVHDWDGPVEYHTLMAFHAFDRAGEYRVVLELEDRHGNIANGSTVVTVRDVEPPLAIAGGDRTVIEGTVVTLDASASSDNVGIAAFHWTVLEDDDGTPLDGEVVEFLFDEPGTFMVRLEVLDAAGNKGLATFNVTVLTLRIDWRLGRFKDELGNPIGGLEVTVRLNGTVYTAVTSEEGWADLTINRHDLVSSVHVTAEGEGWEPMDVVLSLDEHGNPKMPLPLMERKATMEEGDVSLLVLVLAIVILAVAAGVVWKRVRR